ncbi:MAG: hypothetical protein ABFC31_03235 [Clostridiaceae bacterium]
MEKVYTLLVMNQRRIDESMYNKKIVESFLIYLISAMFFLALSIISILKDFQIIGAISLIMLSFLSERTLYRIQDLIDTTSWKKDIRGLLRGRFLNKNEYIRISFAYLYRIKIFDKYLLVKNSRGTRKFQPVGGAYKFNDAERLYLSEKFHICDDSGIPVDNTSKNDYRLHLKAKYLRRFIRRFNSTQNREMLSDLSREFIEELIKPQIVHFDKIAYRYLGRDFSRIQISRHFNCYELLLADIVEVILDEQQQTELEVLLTHASTEFGFFNSEDIKRCGIKPRTNDMHESIGDHTRKILVEYEESLTKTRYSSKKFSINLE